MVYAAIHRNISAESPDSISGQMHDRFVLDRVALEQLFLVVPQSPTVSIIAPSLFTQPEYYISQNDKWARPLNLQTNNAPPNILTYCEWSVNNKISIQSPYHPLLTIQLSVRTESAKVAVRCLEMSIFCVCVNTPGARDGAVVEALRYKPEGRGIDP
jgi:hypothetical protein